MFRKLQAIIVGAVLCLASALPSKAQLVITPTTTLTAQTANNTSAPDTFAITQNGNAAPGNVSKISVKTLAYPGFAGKVIVHMMGWWSPSKSGHLKMSDGVTPATGYTSDDPAQVQKQLDDMKARGFDGMSLAWYGQSEISDKTFEVWRQKAEATGGFTIALRINEDVIKKRPSGQTPEQAIVAQLQYASKYFTSSAYMKRASDSRPIVLFFMTKSTCSTTSSTGVITYCDWESIRSQVSSIGNGNPLFMFKDKRFMTTGSNDIPGSDGGFSWGVEHAIPSSTADGYYKDFYQNAQNVLHASKMIWADINKGMDDSAASWSTGKFQDQRCGKRWLDSFSEIVTYGTTIHPYEVIAAITWNDFEEGTAIETGIDPCFSVSANIAVNTVNFSPATTDPDATEATIDHWKIWISTDGQNLMQVGSNLAASARSFDISTLSLGVGNYKFYVQAVGKPSILNKMSSVLGYVVAPTGAITYSTTLNAETSNNTSASNLLPNLSSGVPAPKNTSRVAPHGMLYSGTTTEIYPNLMQWFCMNAGSSAITTVKGANHCNSHNQVGYNSDDLTQTQKQIDDMIGRGFNGVIVDFYGRRSTSATAALLKAKTAVEARSGTSPNFRFSVLVDQQMKYTCDVSAGKLNGYTNITDCLINELTQEMVYLRDNVFASTQYKKLNNKPLVLLWYNRGDKAYAGTDWSRLHTTLRSNVSSYPAGKIPVLAEVDDGFYAAGSDPQYADGGFAWVKPASSPTDWGYAYLDWINKQAITYGANTTAKPYLSAMYPGFNDTLADWSDNRIMNRTCGGTYLASAYSVNWNGTSYSPGSSTAYFSPTRQLQMMIVPTWNDYEEGTTIESGIDPCTTLSASFNVTAGTLDWSVGNYTVQVPKGSVTTLSFTTVDHFTVYATQETGSNPQLMVLQDNIAASQTASLTLSNYSLPAGTWYFYVKLHSKNSMHSRMSGALGPYTASGSTNVNAPQGVLDAAALTNEGTVVKGNGWAADAQDNAPVTRVEIKLDGTLLGNARLNLSRPDVAATFGNDLWTNSGFDFSFTIPAIVGQHTVTATAFDSNGNFNVLNSRVVDTAASSPSCTITASPSSGGIPHTVNATANCSDPNGDIQSIVIDWGDGSNSSSTKASHTYTQAGTYKVTATAVDSGGRVGAAATSVIATQAVTGSEVILVTPVDQSYGYSPMRVYALANAAKPPVTKMELYVDDVLLYETDNGTIDKYVFLDKGEWHDIKVVAYDSENSSFSSKSRVFISNK